MTKTVKVCLFALGFLAATGLNAARAAEAFLCEGGKIVYVKIAELEKMKRIHPCIAGYFGLSVDKDGTDLDPEAPTKAETAVQPSETASSVEKSPPGIPVALRPLRDPELSHRGEKARTRVASSPEPPRASEGTDYRNVTLLNAGSASEAIFRHER
jgi:hypothetical protein